MKIRNDLQDIEKHVDDLINNHKIRPTPIILPPDKDYDRDGVKNIFDCQPRNSLRQDMTPEEEEILLEKIRQKVERDQKKTGEQVDEADDLKSTKTLTEDYYTQHPKKRPIMSRVKKRIAENRVEKQKERDVYKKAYRKTKYQALKQRANRQAQRRFGRTTGEKVSRAVLGPKKKPARNVRVVQKKRQQGPVKKDIYKPGWGTVNEDVLGPWGGSGKPKKFDVDFRSQLGSMSGKKKKKNRGRGDFNPFEPLF